MLRDFIAAGLVDHLHVVVVPILLGRGVRLWDGLEGVEQQYDVEVVSTPAGVTHLTFTRSRIPGPRTLARRGPHEMLARSQRRGESTAYGAGSEGCE